MAIDTTTSVYQPAYGILSRSVTFTPSVSQPGEPAYGARGIFSSQPVDVATEAGAILSDQVTILDIIEREFSVLPAQGDIVDIPASGAIPAEGTFDIIDRSSNGGGETTLTLRRRMTARPLP